MIDYIYIYVQLHIDIYTSSKVYCSADLPTLETRQSAAVLECVLKETPLYLLYYHRHLRQLGV